MIEKLDKAIALMEQTELISGQVSHAFELRERLQDRELIVSVIGKFKTGKSSLINALLEEQILPVGIIPLTTVVTEIRRGKSFRAVVCFANGSEQEIKRGDLSDYISEQKNPDNEKRVLAVKLWTTHASFDADITLVDTPGVGSVHLHNTETSHAFIEKSDAVLFLLSVDSPVSQTELDFLLKARKHSAKFYFAVNKIDVVSEEDLKEFLSYCKRVLSEAIGIDVKLFPLSTKTGERMISLKEKFNYDLQVSYDELLEASVSIKLDVIIAQAKAKLDLYLKASKTPIEELETKMLQIKAKQLMLQTLSDEFQIVVKSQTAKLVQHIDEHLEELLPSVRTVIQAKADQFNEDFKSLPSKQFENEFTAPLEKDLSHEIKALNDAGLDLLKKGYSDIVDSFNKKAMEAAFYISAMVLEFFDVEYPVGTKTYPVSERDDNYIRLTLYKGISGWVHLLPRVKANEEIFERLTRKAMINLDENKTRLIANYHYKMRESLRLLSVEFSADIRHMSTELDELLAHAERGHNIQGEEQHQVEETYGLLIQQLDGLSVLAAKEG